MKLCGLLLMFIASLITVNTFAQKPVIAQKPAIDFDAIEKWPTIGDAKISNDGKYVAYTIHNQPYKSQTLVVKATEVNWERAFFGANVDAFSDDSRKDVFMKDGDSLGIVNLGMTAIEYIPNVQSFKLFRK